MTRTTEQLRERIRGLEITLQHKNWEAVKADLECLKELLAVREAQPIGFIEQSGLDYLKSGSDADVWPEGGPADIAVYTAPPAPAVNNLISVAQRLVGRYIANKGTTSEFIACVTPEKLSIGTGGTWDDWRLLDAALNACRAAMLHSGNSGIPAIPDGYKLMPVEMTDKIGEAIAMEANCCGGIALDIYNAALAAAPTPTK